MICLIPEPDYIVATLQARANVNVHYVPEEGLKAYPTSIEPWAVVKVKFLISKADGEREIFYRTTDGSGWTDMVQATFNVYKEQPVSVLATAEGAPVDSMYFASDYYEFSWEVIWAAAGDFGKSCAFSSSLSMYKVEITGAN